MNPSGLRLGTPALTTRGFAEEEMGEIADVIAAALAAEFDEEQRDSLSLRTRPLMDQHPPYAQLSPASSAAPLGSPG